MEKFKLQIEQEKGKQKLLVCMSEWTPKYFSNLIPSPKIIHFGPKKNEEMAPKLGQYQKSELKET